MRPSAVSGLLIFAIAAAACTVKEDRTFCPAWCVLYSDGHVAEGCSGDLTCNVATDEENSVEFGQKDYSSFTSRGDLVLEIPRNENVYLDVFCGVDEMARTGPVRPSAPCLSYCVLLRPPPAFYALAGAASLRPNSFSTRGNRAM